MCPTAQEFQPLPKKTRRNEREGGRKKRKGRKEGRKKERKRKREKKRKLVLRQWLYPTAQEF